MPAGGVGATIDDLDAEAGVGEPVDDGLGAQGVRCDVLYHAVTVSRGCDRFAGGSTFPYDHCMKRRTNSASPYEERYGFSRGLRSGNRIEIAGTAPIPPDGEGLAPTAYEQLLRCGEIAIAALAELGATPGDVVRTRMYITDGAEADEIGRAHRELFGEAAPAATMVVVAGLLDPEWKVELEVEAEVDAAGD